MSTEADRGGNQPPPRSADAILDWLHRIREESWEERKKAGDEEWLKEINRPGGYEEYLKRHKAQKTP